MIIIPQYILNDINIEEIFLVTPKRCYKLNKQSPFHYVHPSIDNFLTEYKISINYKNGETSEIVINK